MTPFKLMLLTVATSSSIVAMQQVAEVVTTVPTDARLPIDASSCAICCC